MFAAYLSRWDLTQDGDPVVTPSSCLVPVLRGTAPAMLKVYRTGDEAAGGSLMDWWSGDGAAMVIRVDRTACLMERAAGFGSLSDMSRSGQDDDACQILCSVARRLHAPRSAPPPGLVPLEAWFSDLDAATGRPRRQLRPVVRFPPPRPGAPRVCQLPATAEVADVYRVLAP